VSATPSTSFLSYLDLISCAFGGAVLLFLIVSVSGTPSGDEEAAAVPMIVVRCFHADAVNAPKAEVGIEYRRPGHLDWERPKPGSKQTEVFAATSEPNSGAEAFLLLFGPETGPWEFQPYLINFSRQEGVPCELRMKIEVIGENVRPDPNPQPLIGMKLPGEVGQVVKVNISGR
jgi:hypothetical protein